MLEISALNPYGRSWTDGAPLSSSTAARHPLLHRTRMNTWACPSPKCVGSVPRLSLIVLTDSKVPNETFKAASHLVVTGMKRKYPNVKIILAHLGGSTPWLAPRVAVLSTHMGCPLTPSQILDDFKSFYFDTALSAYDTNLTAMLKFVKPDRLLFGTDCPGEANPIILLPCLRRSFTL